MTTEVTLDTKRREFFDERAENWLDMWYKNPETGEYTRFENEFSRLFGFINLKPGTKTLDLGCGSGVLVPYILERTAPNGKLVEVDYAENMIAVNRKLHNDPRIKFIAADVLALNLEKESFDTVICFSCFPHFSKKQETLRVIAGLLKPDCRLFISHFDSAEDINSHHSKHESVMHDHLPCEHEMRRMLENAGFRVEEFIDEKGFYLIQACKTHKTTV